MPFGSAQLSSVNLPPCQGEREGTYNKRFPREDEHYYTPLQKCLELEIVNMREVTHQYK